MGIRAPAGVVCRILLFALLALFSCSAAALAQDGRHPDPSGSTSIRAADVTGLHALLALVPAQYAGAGLTHDTTLATVVRALAQGARTRAPRNCRPSSTPAITLTRPRRSAALNRLATMLRATTVRFQPWPLASEVGSLSTRAQRELDLLLHTPRVPAQPPYGQITADLREVEQAAASGRGSEANFALLRAYALYAAGPGQRLQTADPPLADRIAQDELLGSSHQQSLAYLLAHGATAAQIAAASARVRADMSLLAQTLGEVSVSHATIVANAAIIVFREGLEAVLILAAITASFVGARSHLRRPIIIGAFAGLGATALTWVVAQMVLHMLGDGGLKLQAVTGLLAIGVLLLVTNWFFHRVYWSEWISRFNRRRKTLERWEGVGFISGQILGFVLLGLSSVYREGLETVLFLQALQTSAGTQATVLGAGIGLSATLLVGVVTLKLQRKLPLPADAGGDRRADRPRVGGDGRHDRAHHAGGGLAADHPHQLQRAGRVEHLARGLFHLGGHRRPARRARLRPRLLLPGPGDSGQEPAAQRRRPIDRIHPRVPDRGRELMTAGAARLASSDAPAATDSRTATVPRAATGADVAFTFSYLSWDAASRRGWFMPEDRLAKTLLTHERVRRLLVCDRVRSLPLKLLRDRCSRGGVPFPADEQTRLLARCGCVAATPPRCGPCAARSRRTTERWSEPPRRWGWRRRR